MSWMDVVDSGIERLVLRRRRERKRREGRWDWWDDEWRVERALAHGIRYTDEELLAMMLGPSQPLFSYNEAARAMDLFLAANASTSRSNEQPEGQNERP